MATEAVARRLLQQPRVGLLLMPLLMHLARPAAAQADNKAAARAHFETGVAAFSDRRFAEAAEEFKTAYRLSPAFVVLYNIGEVSVALGKAVEAVDAFDQYLKQGASAISVERRQEVLDEIEKQRARTGAIAVRTFPEGASIRLDGAVVGKTPLPSALRVSMGQHAIEASLAGHAPETREVTVEGRANLVLEITLESLAEPAAAQTSPPAEPPPNPIVERVVIETQGSPLAPAPAAVEKRADQPERAAATSSINIQRVAGVVVTAGGIATATIGGILAYRGSNQASDARDRLTTATGADWDAAEADFDAGKSRNQHGWITAGVGAGITLGGIVLIATASQASSPIALAPWMVRGSGGLAMNGAW